MAWRIADESENRRGLVLGLTLAELLLLLLFVLLLALCSQILDRDKIVAAANERSEHLKIRLASVESQMAALSPLLSEFEKKGGLSTAQVKDLVGRLGTVEALEQKLIELQKSRSQLTAEVIGLRAILAEKKLDAYKDAISEAAKIDPNDPPAALRRAVEVLSKLGSETTPDQVRPLSEMNADVDARQELSALKVESDKYRRQIANLVRSGNGLTYPSCWLTSEGQTEYMFDITIRDGGLVVHDATPARSNDPQMKLNGPFERGKMIHEASFDRATQRVYDWSVKEQCRFYAILRDETGDSKTRYKKLRTIVEGHFYPLHRPGQASPPRSPRVIPTIEPDEEDPAAPMGGPYIPASGLR